MKSIIGNKETKNFKEETVTCATCKNTIPMSGKHYVAFGLYQCEECQEKEASNVFSMLHGECPRCTTQIKTEFKLGPNYTCSQCGFSISSISLKDLRRLRRRRNAL
jgi:predicted RNA-binding Zn-ribbon protein involved in translation (DUF1610 family)